MTASATPRFIMKSKSKSKPKNVRIGSQLMAGWHDWIEQAR